MVEKIPPALGWTSRAIPYWGARAWWLAKAKPLGAVGAFVVFALIVIAIFESQIATHPPVQTNVALRLESPNSTFLLGPTRSGVISSAG